MRRDFSLTQEPTKEEMKELASLFADNPFFMGIERNDEKKQADIIVGLNGPDSLQNYIIRIDGYTLERLWDWAEMKDLFKLKSQIQEINNKVCEATVEDVKPYGTIMQPSVTSAPQGLSTPSP